MRTKIATYFKIFEIMRAEKAASKVTIKHKKKSTPIGVLFLFGETGPDRFEDLNADVRWTSACRQLDGGNTIIFLPIGKKNANKSGRYLPRRSISKVHANNEKKPHTIRCAAFDIFLAS